jgi:hypothetical protein
MKSSLRAMTGSVTRAVTLGLALGVFAVTSGFAQTAKPAAMDNKADTKMAAPGGGPGKVWVSTGSKRYHCEGSRFYGKTKAGEYMSEADAKAKGIHGVKGKDCPK